MHVNSISFKADTPAPSDNTPTSGISNPPAANSATVKTQQINEKSKTDIVEIKKEEKNIQTEKKNNKTEFQKDIWKEIGMKKPSPIVIGLGSGALWFGIGALMDKGLSKIWKGYQYNAKNSMYINGAFGVVMGTMDFFRARKKD